MLSDVIGTALALGVVIILAYVALEVVRRLRAVEGGRQEIRFIQALPVGARERLVVVRWRDELLVLGVTPGGITALGSRQLTPEEAASARTPPTPSEAATSIVPDPMGRLLQALRRPGKS